MLSHVGHNVLGMNTVQLYMKIPGCRTPGMSKLEATNLPFYFQFNWLRSFIETQSELFLRSIKY